MFCCSNIAANLNINSVSASLIVLIFELQTPASVKIDNSQVVMMLLFDYIFLFFWSILILQFINVADWSETFLIINTYVYCIFNVPLIQIYFFLTEKIQ